MLGWSNDSNRDIQSKILQRMYNRSTPEEQRWIVRIILKGTWRLAFLVTHAHHFVDMIISVKENTVFGVFHPDAYDLFNTCSDLKKVVWELCDPHRRLNDEVSYVCFASLTPSLPSPLSGQSCSVVPCVCADALQASDQEDRRFCEGDARSRLHHRGET